jgi:hypothetical protein
MAFMAHGMRERERDEILIEQTWNDDDEICCVIFTYPHHCHISMYAQALRRRKISDVFHKQ